jgi:lipoprotein-releasing system ATP-binding protein
MNRSEILRAESITKSFSIGNEVIDVLKGINLSVSEGTTVVITGESGSGKSTFLNLVGGIDSPSTGTITVRGEEITRLNEEELAGFRNKTVGFIFQFHFLLKDFSALENVMMPAFISGSRPAYAHKKAMMLLDEVGLSHRTSHYLVELSGGERQRVAVARALMNDPDIIIADEPTGNLDEKNSMAVQDLLFALTDLHRKTMLLVTHDTALAMRATEHLRLEHGVLVNARASNAAGQGTESRNE